MNLSALPSVDGRYARVNFWVMPSSRQASLNSAERKDRPLSVSALYGNPQAHEVSYGLSNECLGILPGFVGLDLSEGDATVIVYGHERIHPSRCCERAGFGRR